MDTSLEEFIKKNPGRADALASEWSAFLKSNAPKHPELYSITKAEEFYGWANKEHFDPSIWKGKEISEAYFDLREQDEDLQMSQEGAIDDSKLPTALAAVPFLAAAFLTKPKIIEEDGAYKKIEENLKKEWLKNNPGKDFSTKEGIDYMYGSLDDPTKTSLSKEAEKSFRADPRYAKRAQRYDKEREKVYKKPTDDPAIQRRGLRVQEEINARLELTRKEVEGRKYSKWTTNEEIKKLNAHEMETSQLVLGKRVDEKSKGEFIQKAPKKALAYKFINEEQMKIRNQNQINKDLGDYKASSGKDIRYVEKTHRSPSGVSASEANKIIQEISNYRETLPTLTKTPSVTVPTLNVPGPTQGGQPQGGITRGINSINNIMHGGIKNPLGGSKIAAVAKMAAKRFAAWIATNPWIWAVFVSAFVSVVTFLTGLFLGPTE
jgi:hypothetical protein